MTTEEIVNILDSAKTWEEYVALARKFCRTDPIPEGRHNHELDADQVEGYLARSLAGAAAHEEFRRHGKVTTARCPKCGQVIEHKPIEGKRCQVRCGCGEYDFTYNRR